MARKIMHINPDSPVPKYQQVIDALMNAIENGKLQMGDKLPSINQLCMENEVRRDTVMFALNHMKARGLVTSRQGKGYYICSNDVGIKDRYFVLLDNLNQNACDLYLGFVHAMKHNVIVDLFFCNNDEHKLKEVISSSLGKYSCFVFPVSVMDRFSAMFHNFPQHKIIVIGKCFDRFNNVSCIYQDHGSDIYESLKLVRRKLKKYLRLVYLHQGDFDPEGRSEGFVRFCQEENFDYLIHPHKQEVRPAMYEAYITGDDAGLVQLIARINTSRLEIGESVGIISFGDTALKHIVSGGLTTIDTDFSEAGDRLADLAVTGKRGHIRVRPRIFQRKSL